MQKEALQALAEAAKIFIHFLTATANEVCHESKRLTISASDVLQALEEVDFPEYVQPLKEALAGAPRSVLQPSRRAQSSAQPTRRRTRPPLRRRRRRRNGRRRRLPTLLARAQRKRLQGRQRQKKHSAGRSTQAVSTARDAPHRDTHTTILTQ